MLISLKMSSIFPPKKSFIFLNLYNKKAILYFFIEIIICKLKSTALPPVELLKTLWEKFRILKNIYREQRAGHKSLSFWSI